MIGMYKEGLGLEDVTILSDPDRSAYDEVGFGRAPLWRVWLDPRVWIGYGGLVLRGRRPRLPSEDTLQLGGDLILDREHIVRWIRPSEGPEDRPSVAEVEAALAGVRAAA